MLSACAQLGILAAGLIARRHNAARVSMMSFSSAETRAESMCYHRRAYAPRTQVVLVSRDRAIGLGYVLVHCSRLSAGAIIKVLFNGRDEVIQCRSASLDLKLSLPPFWQFSSKLRSIEPADPNRVGKLPALEPGDVA